MYLIAHKIFIISFVISLYGIIAAIYSAVKKKYNPLESSYNSIIGIFLLITLAVLLLIRGFVADDYSLEYVAMHSNRAMPLIYKISALWGGQEGSLLFWTWLLLLYSVILIIRYRKKYLELMPIVSATLLIIINFFLTLLLFPANPFKILEKPLPDGQGLNPLLQDPGMMLHPPALYLGFVGFSIPFAFAIASLISNKLDITWIKITRNWTLISWIFLTIGIVLGAKWAYIELGWGGYWAWDPVENASLIPWLTATAYLHSVIIQEKKNMLRLWNMILIVSTFFLCILGTFLTRSGIISSVHTFAESPIGSFFLIFLAFILFFCSALILSKLEKIKGEEKLESILSRESSFLFNNLLFMALAIAVLWGTIFPMLSEAITGDKITVAAPFFNKVASPLAILLLLLTALCPFIAWRKASLKKLLFNLAIPIIISVVISVIFIFSITNYSGWVIAFIFSCAFLISTIALEFYKGTKARQSLKKENFTVAFLKLILKNRRRYLGFIIHFSVAIIFIGIVASNFYQEEKEVVLKKGNSIHFGNYIIKYNNLFVKSDSNKTSVRAKLDLYASDNLLTNLYPGKDFHITSEQPMTEVAIYSNWKADLYAILVGWEEDETASFKFFFNPLVNWIWFGSILMIIASILLVLPERFFKKPKEKL